jgi:hypothetical protein
MLLGIFLGAAGLKAVQAVRHRASGMRSESHGSMAGMDHSGGQVIDWSRASDVDLEVAPVFLTAAHDGLGASLDSLNSLTRRDAKLAALGPAGLHQVAHMLGRFAIAHAHNDPLVFRECRPGFLSGCQHGVMEGYFATRPPLDSTSLAGLCTRIAPAVPAVAMRECAHGMGHGVIEAAGGDLRRALGLCGALGNGDLWRECTDGVFMSSVQADIASFVRGERTTGRRCDQLDGRYAPSCWSYEAALSLTRDAKDLTKSLAECDSAPPSAVGACYWGFGKQSAGLYPEQPARIAKACREGKSNRGAECRAGAVAYYTDVSWTADGAVSFCRSVEPDEKNDCYGALGVAMRAMQSDTGSFERECRKSEPVYVARCITSGRAGKAA